MTETKTSNYNLYRAFFIQPNNPDHEALALIPETSASQQDGILHHVTGTLALGMEYSTRRSRGIRKEKGYSRSVFLETIAKDKIASFEGICSTVTPPHDERLLFENRAKLEAKGEKNRDCAGWIDDVVAMLIE